MTRRAASPRDAAPAQVCALWTDLLARLSLAAVASAQAQAHAQLRALGVRRTGTVATNLARELSMAHRMAASAGVCIPPQELRHRVGELARPGALATHLGALVAAYRHIMFATAMPPDGPLAKWITGRLHVHQVQLASMEQIEDRCP